MTTTIDITCKPNPWAPGYWIISADSNLGRQWWAAEHYPDIGWELGAGSFAFQEVREVLLSMPAGMTASFNGRQLLMTEQQEAASDG